MPQRRKRLARKGVQAVAANPHYPVANVARNIEAIIRQTARTVHTMIYANVHGHAPADILAALGGSATPVQAILTSADALSAAPPATPPASGQ